MGRIDIPRYPAVYSRLFASDSRTLFKFDIVRKGRLGLRSAEPRSFLQLYLMSCVLKVELPMLPAGAWPVYR
jgi:hypothetical protein